MTSKQWLDKQWLDYQAPENLLEGRNILVTGAGDGIGKAVAKTYAASGATVILAGRTVSKLEAVYDQIEADGGPQPAIYPVDFANAGLGDYNHLAETVEKELGSLQGIVFNASELGQRTPISQYDPETWETVMRVNLNSQFMITQQLLPLMEQQSDASIILTSSGVGRKGRAYWGAYAVSKFATEGFMETLADELDGTSNVRVNCLNPGATRTRMRRKAYPAEDPQNLKTPDQIMPLYLFLMGSDGKGINGRSIDCQPKD